MVLTHVIKSNIRPRSHWQVADKHCSICEEFAVYYCKNCNANYCQNHDEAFHEQLENNLAGGSDINKHIIDIQANHDRVLIDDHDVNFGTCKNHDDR